MEKSSTIVYHCIWNETNHFLLMKLIIRQYIESLPTAKDNTLSNELIRNVDFNFI